jgi:alpha-L-fucosidase 2
MDANFGYTAGVAEMLLQSHLRSEDGRREINLLPALPASWPSGEVTGLRARDGFTVDQKWENGKLVSARISSRLGRPVRVRYQGKTTDLDIPAGTSQVYKP